VKVTENNARKLLFALGAKNAPRFLPKVLAKRLGTIETDYSDRVRMAVTDPTMSRMMRSIIAAARMQEPIEIITDRPTPVKETPKEEFTETSFSEVEEEEDEEAVPVQPTTKEPPKRKLPKVQQKTVSKPHKEGTIKRMIFEMLVKATKNETMTKDYILDRLAVEFPGKQKMSLAASVNGMPHWLPQHYPYDVVKVGKGYYLEPWG